MYVCKCYSIANLEVLSVSGVVVQIPRCIFIEPERLGESGVVVDCIIYCIALYNVILCYVLFCYGPL